MFLSCRSKYVSDIFILSTQSCRSVVQQTTSTPCRCPHRFSQLRFLYASSQLGKRQETIMNVFDRQAKRKQKNRTALLDDYNVYDYLREEIGYRVADRICDVRRQFPVALDLGCGRGHVAKHVLQDMVGILYQADMAEDVLAQAEKSPEVPTVNLHLDEELLPFRPNTLDLVVSSLSLHWVNDLPGCFKRIHTALRNDGCFIGSMFGGDTLFELRVSLQLAESEREGGFAAHISPFTSVQDLGNLLNRAGFTMLTIDIDEMTINYPSIIELMYDLKGMGENNASWSRKVRLNKDTILAALALYKELYGKKGEDEIPATFQIINFIGWKPDASQPKPAKRGSGQISMKDIDKIDSLTQQIKDLRKDTSTSEQSTNSKDTVDQLTKDIEKLRKHTLQTEEKDQDKKIEKSELSSV